MGSILSMDRQVLIKGFLKIFVPLAIGSIAAGAVGTAVGTTLGLGAYHTFFVVVPIMAGGVGEGAIPLSVGYAEIEPGIPTRFRLCWKRAPTRTLARPNGDRPRSSSPLRTIARPRSRR